LPLPKHRRADNSSSRLERLVSRLDGRRRPRSDGGWRHEHLRRLGADCRRRLAQIYPRQHCRRLLASLRDRHAASYIGWCPRLTAIRLACVVVSRDNGGGAILRRHAARQKCRQRQRQPETKHRIPNSRKARRSAPLPKVALSSLREPDPIGRPPRAHSSCHAPRPHIAA
jgi:hypothetical protein